MDDHEKHEFEWQEHWFIVGDVSKAATEAIEAVGGSVVRMKPSEPFIAGPRVYGVRLIWHPEDEEQGFDFYQDEGLKARELLISSPDTNQTLYFCCKDGSVPSLEADVTQLRLISQEEWFAHDDGE